MALEYIGRKKWGARYAAGAGPRAIPVSECWLHHAATLAPDLAFDDLNADAVDDDEAKAMRDIEAIGQQRFGQGFSYNLAVMPSGRIYVGCGVRRVGSHTAKRNTRALGIVLVGNYHERPLPAPMRAVLPELLREAHRLGWITQPKFNGGHRDLRNTSCPGDLAYEQIAAINREAAGESTNDPSIPPAPPEKDDYVRLSDEDVDRIAQRTRQVIADGTKTYGLDSLRRLLELLLQAVDALPAKVAAAVKEQP